MKNNKQKNTKNSKSKLCQLSPDSQLLLVDLEKISGGIGPGIGQGN